MKFFHAPLFQPWLLDTWWTWGIELDAEKEMKHGFFITYCITTIHPRLRRYDWLLDRVPCPSRPLIIDIGTAGGLETWLRHYSTIVSGSLLSYGFVWSSGPPHLEDTALYLALGAHVVSVEAGPLDDDEKDGICQNERCVDSLWCESVGGLEARALWDVSQGKGMCNMLVYLFWIIVEDVSGQSIGSQLQQKPFDETDAKWKAETAECQDQHRYPPWGTSNCIEIGSPQLLDMMHETRNHSAVPEVLYIM